MNTPEYDVVVVGGGNAALAAALSARESGARVAVLERAAEGERGGNSAFTAGTMRAVYSGVDDIRRLVPDLSPAELEETDFSSYTTDQYFDDMARVTRYRTHPDLCETLVTQSNAALHWLRSKGVRFIPAYAAQSFKVGGKRKFWGGVTVGTVGGFDPVDMAADAPGQPGGAADQAEPDAEQVDDDQRHAAQIDVQGKQLHHRRHQQEQPDAGQQHQGGDEARWHGGRVHRGTRRRLAACSIRFRSAGERVRRSPGWRRAWS